MAFLRERLGESEGVGIFTSLPETRAGKLHKASEEETKDR